MISTPFGRVLTKWGPLGVSRTNSGEIRALDLKAGDKVLFGKYSGTEVKVDGEELLVMKEDDVMAVIEG